MTKVKLMIGYNKSYSIDSEEAHKAYYLFLNPGQRGVFKNGTAVRGQDIMGIEPDYHSVFGWNESHKLTGEDWNEINKSEECEKLRQKIEDARELANNQEALKVPLSEAQTKLLTS